MIINKISVEDTFAEAFPMKATRLIVTANSMKWAKEAAASFTGFATSVIACGCESGVETELNPRDTPDSRPGLSILVFSMSSKELARQVLNRAGQSIMTTPSTALFAGNEGTKGIKLGNALRYFGDGFQISKIIGKKKFWRIPVMDGEFFCEDFAYEMSAIGGGNLIVLGENYEKTIIACEKAVREMQKVKNTILPFPGGIVRSGSKVGSKYKQLLASTNFEYCPSLSGIVDSKIKNGINCVLEIVIDGLSECDISRSMKIGIDTILQDGENNGIKVISAGNYGGKLGPYLFKLKSIIK